MSTLHEDCQIPQVPGDWPYFGAIEFEKVTVRHGTAWRLLGTGVALWCTLRKVWPRLVAGSFKLLVGATGREGDHAETT